MSVFILLFLIPFSFADSPPACSELGKIVQNYETDLQKKFIGSPGTACQDLKLEDLTPPEQGVTTANDIVSTVLKSEPEYFNDRRCLPLSAIESELEHLKNEEAVLTGIDKLKNEIKISQEESGDKDLAVARSAGLSFVSSLNTAQSLELLLQSSTKEKESFLSHLKKIPTRDRKNLVDFTAKISGLCKESESSDVVTACDPNFFKPNQDAVTEINALIDQAEPTPDQIKKWKSMLAIKKKGAAPEKALYSFTEMRETMENGLAKLDSGAGLSRADLKVIRNLDQFENARGLSFVEDLAKVKDQFKNQFASDQFRFLVGDAQRREEHQIQSKISLIWAEVKGSVGTLNETETAACADSKLFYDSARTCYRILSDKVRNGELNGNTRSHLNSLMEPLEASMNYVSKLSGIQESCLDEIKTKGVLPNGCLKEIGPDKAMIQKKILALNLIKEKIGSENQKEMAFRNFALYKWGTQKCSMLDSSIEFCDDKDLISKEANLLTDDLMDISLVFAPRPEAENVAESLCNEDVAKRPAMEEKLCAFFNDTTPDHITDTKEEKKDDLGPAVSAPTRKGAEREAWITGLSKAFNDVAASYRPPIYTPGLLYPYPYNFAPYNPTANMGIADSILFNARYHGGYGYYMPTKGVTPYTAFGNVSTMVNPYQALQRPTTTSYFGR